MKGYTQVNLEHDVNILNDERCTDTDNVDLARRIIVLTLARMIYEGNVIPEEIKTKGEMASILETLGSTHDHALEIHIDEVEQSINLVRHTLDQGMHRSAIVLLFTLLEGEINCVVRVLLRIRGYTHNAISDALKGTDFHTKINVLLPLLGVEMAQHLRQVAQQCKTIRNLIVHNKATPDLLTDSGDTSGDYEITQLRARQFFEKHHLEQVEKGIRAFVNGSVSSIPEVQTAWSLLTGTHFDQKS